MVSAGRPTTPPSRAHTRRRVTKGRIPFTSSPLHLSPWLPPFSQLHPANPAPQNLQSQISNLPLPPPISRLLSLVSNLPLTRAHPPNIHPPNPRSKPKRRESGLPHALQAPARIRNTPAPTRKQRRKTAIKREERSKSVAHRRRKTPPTRVTRGRRRTPRTQLLPLTPGAGALPEAGCWPAGVCSERTPPGSASASATRSQTRSRRRG